MAHPLEQMMETSIAKLRELVDVDTVVGKPVHVNENTMVIPVSKVSFGFVSGGGEYDTKNPILKSGVSLDNSNRAFPFAGTMTAGVCLRPTAFLYVCGERVSVLPAESDDALERLVSSLPTLADEAGRLIKQLAKKPDSDA